MSTSSQHDHPQWESSEHHVGRAVGLVLAILGFIPTAWGGLLSLGFYLDGGEDRAISGFADGPGLPCLVMAGFLLVAICAILRPMSRDRP